MFQKSFHRLRFKSMYWPMKERRLLFVRLLNYSFASFKFGQGYSECPNVIFVTTQLEFNFQLGEVVNHIQFNGI